MGGKRKLLTQTRRKALEKEMTDGLIKGTFTTNGRPLDEILDEVNTGIQEGRYPIEVDLAQLIAIWSGTPAPTEAPAPEPQPTNHGTVDQIQQAQQNGQQIPANIHAGGQVNGQPAEQWQAQQVAAGYGPTPQQAAEMNLPAVAPTVQQPSQLAAAAGVAPGQLVPTSFGPQPVQSLPQQHVVQPMTLQQAQAAMTAVEAMEVGEPPKEPPVEIDASPVADWISIAHQAKAKIDAAKDILEQAKANAAAYADQVGGPDRSKVLLLNGQLVLRRTFIKKKVFKKESLLAAHPEIDESAFTEYTPYYKTELA